MCCSSSSKEQEALVMCVSRNHLILVVWLIRLKAWIGNSLQYRRPC